jgi:hypothetical protein
MSHSPYSHGQQEITPAQINGMENIFYLYIGGQSHVPKRLEGEG